MGFRRLMVLFRGPVTPPMLLCSRPPKGVVVDHECILQSDNRLEPRHGSSNFLAAWLRQGARGYIPTNKRVVLHDRHRYHPHGGRSRRWTEETRRRLPIVALTAMKGDRETCRKARRSHQTGRCRAASIRPAHLVHR